MFTLEIINQRKPRKNYLPAHEAARLLNVTSYLIKEQYQFGQWKITPDLVWNSQDFKGLMIAKVIDLGDGRFDYDTVSLRDLVAAWVTWDIVQMRTTKVVESMIVYLSNEHAPVVLRISDEFYDHGMIWRADYFLNGSTFKWENSALAHPEGIKNEIELTGKCGDELFTPEAFARYEEELGV